MIGRDVTYEEGQVGWENSVAILGHCFWTSHFAVDPSVVGRMIRLNGKTCTVVQRPVAPQRWNATLLGVFSTLALLLATTGIYGVLSYSISRRASEIGLRVALGASRGSILRMALTRGMPPVVLGVGFGIAGAWWLSRYIVSLLFGVPPLDWVTYADVTALLLATALAACLLPGVRAMRTDPASALRLE